MSINGEKIRKELSEGIPQIPLEDLRTLQSDYPYFQAIRFLYLKRVQKEEPLLYPEALERNAIYSGDRKSLFFLLEGARQSWTSLYRQNIESEKSKESFSLIDSFLSAQNENFSESIEQLIFQTGGIPATDYLSLSKTESGNDTSNLNELQNIDLINSFIEKSEKGNPLVTDIDATIKPENTKNIPETPLTESTDEAFLTESLAKIYIKQRRYSKALEIIKKLSLKYPEKNIYFADQIRFLEKLILNIKTEYNVFVHYHLNSNRINIFNIDRIGTKLQRRRSCIRLLFN